MSELSQQQREFVALGAALASNCIPCMEYHISAAGKAGITAVQIREAVELAHAVRRTPAEQVLMVARSRLGSGKGEAAECTPDCCG